MTTFQVGDRQINGYLAVPAHDSGPGVLVLHAWWGLTEPFRQICDQLAEAGFVAFAPDLYQGKTTASIEEAQVLRRAMDEERVNGDIVAAMQLLRQHAARGRERDSIALVGFSLGGGYALTTSIERADEIAAVVTFYTSYPGLDYSAAKAAYLCHFAENDLFEPAESVAQMEQDLQNAGRSATFSTYPGTGHWFFEENRPEYNAQAARLAWERTIAFLHKQLD